jgi:hypothetical protein
VTQAIRDALADAETLRQYVATLPDLYRAPEFYRAGRLGFVVTHPEVGVNSLALYAKGCARAAFLAVPELRG